MNCSKYDPFLIDELYHASEGASSSEVSAHIRQCTRCSQILEAMRSALALARVSIADVPQGLEDRILVSVGTEGFQGSSLSRTSRALSWAGRWSMRPQTAMAAVFLLMIGTSAFALRARYPSERPGEVSVIEQGMPAGQNAPAEVQESLDSHAAAAAHGPNAPLATSRVASSPASVLHAAGAMAPLGDTDSRAERTSKASEEPLVAAGSSALAEEAQSRTQGQERGPIAAAERTLETRSPPSPQEEFAFGMAAYRARNYADALRRFDNAARSGDPRAALWAATAARDGSGGCSVAAPRFDAVADQFDGTWIGNEATLEGARCRITTGQLGAAREKLTKLSNATSHATQAQQALRELDHVSARRETGHSLGSAGGAVPTRPASAAPARSQRFERGTGASGTGIVDSPSKANGL